MEDQVYSVSALRCAAGRFSGSLGADVVGLGPLMKVCATSIPLVDALVMSRVKVPD